MLTKFKICAELRESGISCQDAFGGEWKNSGPSSRPIDRPVYWNILSIEFVPDKQVRANTSGSGTAKVKAELCRSSGSCSPPRVLNFIYTKSQDSIEMVNNDGVPTQRLVMTGIFSFGTSLSTHSESLAIDFSIKDGSPGLLMPSKMSSSCTNRF